MRLSLVSYRGWSCRWPYLAGRCCKSKAIVSLNRSTESILTLKLHSHLGKHALQTPVFLCHRFHFTHHTCVHPTGFGWPLVETGTARAMSASQLRKRYPILCLAQNSHDLCVTECCVLHPNSTWSFLSQKSYFWTPPFFGRIAIHQAHL